MLLRCRFKKIMLSLLCPPQLVLNVKLFEAWVNGVVVYMKIPFILPTVV